MLSNLRVVPTLAVSDMDRARRFYEEGLGLAVEADVVGTLRYSCRGDTALGAVAVQSGSIDVAKKLIAAGADVRHKNKQGKTAL